MVCLGLKGLFAPAQALLGLARNRAGNDAANGKIGQISGAWDAWVNFTRGSNYSKHQLAIWGMGIVRRGRWTGAFIGSLTYS